MTKKNKKEETSMDKMDILIQRLKDQSTKCSEVINRIKADEKHLEFDKEELEEKNKEFIKQLIEDYGCRWYYRRDEYCHITEFIFPDSFRVSDDGQHVDALGYGFVIDYDRSKFEWFEYTTDDYVVECFDCDFVQIDADEVIDMIKYELFEEIGSPVMNTFNICIPRED